MVLATSAWEGLGLAREAIALPLGAAARLGTGLDGLLLTRLMDGSVQDPPSDSLFPRDPRVIQSPSDKAFKLLVDHPIHCDSRTPCRARALARIARITGRGVSHHP